jgi:hypothetical protein
MLLDSSTQARQYSGRQTPGGLAVPTAGQDQTLTEYANPAEVRWISRLASLDSTTVPTFHELLGAGGRARGVIDAMAHALLSLGMCIPTTIVTAHGSR